MYLCKCNIRKSSSDNSSYDLMINLLKVHLFLFQFALCILYCRPWRRRFSVSHKIWYICRPLFCHRSPVAKWVCWLLAAAGRWSTYWQVISFKYEDILYHGVYSRAWVRVVLIDSRIDVNVWCFHAFAVYQYLNFLFFCREFPAFYPFANCWLVIYFYGCEGWWKWKIYLGFHMITIIFFTSN